MTILRVRYSYSCSEDEEADSEGLNDLPKSIWLLSAEVTLRTGHFGSRLVAPFPQYATTRGVWNAEMVFQIYDSVWNVYLARLLLMQRISVHSCSRIIYPWGKESVIVNNYLFLLTFFVPLLYQEGFCKLGSSFRLQLMFPGILFHSV